MKNLNLQKETTRKHNNRKILLEDKKVLNPLLLTAFMLNLILNYGIAVTHFVGLLNLACQNIRNASEGMKKMECLWFYYISIRIAYVYFM
jgi:hypothetical protein